MAAPASTHRTVSVAAGLIAAVVLLSGCGSSQLRAPATVDPEVQAAMVRWDRCVSRVETGEPAPIGFNIGCSGHRRDVATQFPPHLYARVEAQLKARERARLLRTRMPEITEAQAEKAVRQVAAN
jgi:hypothetical protein